MASILGECLLELGCFVLAHLDTEVHEAPPEVVHIQVLVSFRVYGLEDLGQGFQTVYRAHGHLLLEVLKQVSQVEFLQVINGLIVLSTWSCLEDEHILILLKLAGHVRGQSTLILHLQILRLVVSRVVVAVNLVFGAELVLIFDSIISTQEDTGLHVP